MWLSVSLWLASLAITSIHYGWGNDMMNFWGAARTFLDGHDPYLKVSSYPGIRLAPGDQFKHLPWVGLLFCPLAALPFPLAVRIWAAFNSILIVTSVFVARYLHESLPLWGTALIAVAVILMQVRTLQSGQLGILVATAILAALACLRKGRPFVAGALLSVGLFKPWIAVGALGAAVLMAFMRRNYSFLAGLVVGTAIILLGSTLLWPTWVSSFLQVDFSQALGIKAGDEFVQVWPLANLFDFTRYILRWPQTQSLHILQIVMLGLAMGWLVVSSVRKWRAEGVDDHFLVGVGALISVLVIPYVRYYDYAILACWWILVAPALLTMPSAPAWQKWFVLALMLLGLSFLFGSHLEPWVYQLVVCLYAATVVGLVYAGRVRSKEPPSVLAEMSTSIESTCADA